MTDVGESSLEAYLLSPRIDLRPRPLGVQPTTEGWAPLPDAPKGPNDERPN